MQRKLYTGTADFIKLREGNYFYIDKTAFIREWWEGANYNGINDVTLITRPRRFGKSLMQSTVETFFSPIYIDRKNLFKGLEVWKYKKYRSLQGTIPVISLSFGDINSTSFTEAINQFAACMIDLYDNFSFLLDSKNLTDRDKSRFQVVSAGIDIVDIKLALRRLCRLVYKHFNKKPIILLDEYDTPLQAAWVKGYWNELVDFLRDMFDATFKENKYFERSILTGITRVSKESLFSCLNNLKVISTVTEKYMTYFGFTETEVIKAMNEYGRTDIEKVRNKYDGFSFGSVNGIYNPWSITNYLEENKLNDYWVDSSNNKLVDKLVREGDPELKMDMENLLRGGSLSAVINEQLDFSSLAYDTNAVWSLLLATGYLKVVSVDSQTGAYTLVLTNGEVFSMMEQLIRLWFAKCPASYDRFEKALLAKDVKLLTKAMNDLAKEMFSSFDTGKGTSGNEPERFYHGFVLGLLVKMKDRYVVTSNRESGYGRYDIMLIPLNPAADPGIILEFKVQDEEEEKELKDTVAAALRQIEDRQYETELIARGIPRNRIFKYGFAFQGKKVLIGLGEDAQLG